ncbi:MAG TPA: cytochrome c [Bryobacteraceae bacterium]|nr:cytochrome c [Bryobacteraceae bacterium]
MFAKRGFLLLAVILLTHGAAYGHDVITTKVTFDREIVRLFNAHCISCHREGGTAFSLETYKVARPWAKAIGEEVLHRRMPPWGAVKGFGDFRNDKGLTEEQLELIVDWEEGGAPEGEDKDIPPPPKLTPEATIAHSPREIAVSGDQKLTHAIKLDGLWPKTVADGASFQVTAELPDGSIEPLLWLHNYKKAFEHPFLLRTPLELPVGTTIRGVPADSTVALAPWKPGHTKPEQTKK